MDVYAVFNELAVAGTQASYNESSYTARRWMEDFGRLLYAAQQKGIAGLRTYRHFHEIQLVRGYSLTDWANDPQVDRELRERIKLAFLQLYRLPEYPENQQGNPLLEIQFQGEPAFGLGAAYLLESLAISLLTAQDWNAAELPITVYELEEATGDFQSRQEIVRHVGHDKHLDHHATWLDERKRSSVRNGKELLLRAPKLFPHLIFCDNAHKQLRDFSMGSLYFRRVVARMFELEKLSSGGERFDRLAVHNASGESESVLNDPHLRSLREFTCPDGQKRLFDFHLKDFQGKLRIHIFPDDMRRVIYIGHIGEHLQLE